MYCGYERVIHAVAVAPSGICMSGTARVVSKVRGVHLLERASPDRFERRQLSRSCHPLCWRPPSPAPRAIFRTDEHPKTDPSTYPLNASLVLCGSLDEFRPCGCMASTPRVALRGPNGSPPTRPRVRKCDEPDGRRLQCSRARV